MFAISISCETWFTECGNSWLLWLNFIDSYKIMLAGLIKWKAWIWIIWLQFDKRWIPFKNETQFFDMQWPFYEESNLPLPLNSSIGFFEFPENAKIEWKKVQLRINIGIIQFTKPSWNNSYRWRQKRHILLDWGMVELLGNPYRCQGSNIKNTLKWQYFAKQL